MIVTYYNVVTYIVVKAYIVDACNGNIFPAGDYRV